MAVHLCKHGDGTSFLLAFRDPSRWNLKSWLIPDALDGNLKQQYFKVSDIICSLPFSAEAYPN